MFMQRMYLRKAVSVSTQKRSPIIQSSLKLIKISANPTLLLSYEYHTFVPSIVNATRQQERSLDFKYNNVLTFRKKADSRIDILRKIVPIEYQLDDFLLFRSLYSDDSHQISTIYKDNVFPGVNVAIESENVAHLGKKLLKHKVNSFFLKSSIRNDFNTIQPLQEHGEMDSFEFAIKKSSMNFFLLRSHFIRQFLKKFESKSLLEISSENMKLIKLELNSRHGILHNLIGFIYYQHGIEKCTEFIEEFIILGRSSNKKNYSHMGLQELEREKLKIF